ncbi:MAG: beta-galactosidase trimerization domain-containing protein, partial [Terriglobia bacterium]
HLDGTPTARAQAAGRAAQVIEREAAELNEAQPAPARVGVFYDRRSYMVGGSQPTLSKLGNAERDSLLGVYRAFFEKQIPVDFVNSSDIQRGRLRDYRIVFFPFSVMLSRAVADGIRAYVEAGGTAVAGARLAWNDARGYASAVIPGFGLDRVFGGRERTIEPAAAPRMMPEPGTELSGLRAGWAIPGSAFEEALEPHAGAKIMARFSDGAPAIIENHYGKGTAILIGSFPALAYQREHNAATRALFLALARAAGVQPEIEVSGVMPQFQARRGGFTPPFLDGGINPPLHPRPKLRHYVSGSSQVEVRRLVSPESQFVFVFNHAEEATAATIAIRLPWRPRAARDLITGSAAPVSFENGEAVLHMNLPAGGTWIVRLIH